MSDYTPMEREVVEHRLEFDVWGQDCKGWNRYLEALTQLRDTLLRVERMQAVVDAARATRHVLSMLNRCFSMASLPTDIERAQMAEAHMRLAAAVDAYLAGEKKSDPKHEGNNDE